MVHGAFSKVYEGNKCGLEGSGESVRAEYLDKYGIHLPGWDNRSEVLAVGKEVTDAEQEIEN